MPLIVNRYDKFCAVCGTQVAAGQGFSQLGSDNRWLTYCTAHKPGVAKTIVMPAPVVPQCRTLAADGTITITPWLNDANVLNLLRAMPGRRYDPESKVWRVSTDRNDRPQVLELARQLNLQIDPVWLADGRAVVARKAGLYKYQVAGVDWLNKQRRAILGDDMGCIDGDALIAINRAGAGRVVKLSTLFAGFNGQRKWDLAIPTYARSLCDGELRLNKIESVIDKGVRDVFKLTLASGRCLRLTADHEVCTSAGQWIKAADLRPGYKLLTNGKSICKMCGSSDNVSTYHYAKFIGVCKSCIYKKLRVKPTFNEGKTTDRDGYVRLCSMWDHPRANTAGQVYEHIIVMEKYLGRYLDWPYEQVHHKNGDRSNNCIDNLELLTVSEHHCVHGRHKNMDGGIGGRGGKIRFIPVTDKVVSCVPDGQAHVYDVSMTSPYHNFIVNGIVVHNCGKTVETIMALESGEAVLVICPVNVKLNWKREIETWRPEYKPVVLSGRDSFRWPNPGEIVIVNYAILPAWLKEKNVTWKYEDEQAARRTVLVCDEAHAIKSSKSQQHKKVKNISYKAKKVWFLTGTPLTNKVSDLLGLLFALNRFNDTFHTMENFIKRFRVPYNGYGHEWGAARPDNQVPGILAKVMLRRTRQECLPDLPNITYQTLVINDVAANLKKVLDTKWEETRELIEGNELPPFEVMASARRALAVARIPAMEEFVEDCEEQDVPLVVFSAHREPIERLATRPGWAVILGDTPAAKRQQIIDDFQAGKLKGLGMTIQIAQGINLTYAWTCLLVDKDWTPANNDQAIRRLLRIGQKASKINVVSLVTNHPLDIHVNELLDKKIQVIMETVG